MQIQHYYKQSDDFKAVYQKKIRELNKSGLSPPEMGHDMNNGGGEFGD